MNNEKFKGLIDEIKEKFSPGENVQIICSPRRQNIVRYIAEKSGLVVVTINTIDSRCHDKNKVLVIKMCGVSIAPLQEQWDKLIDKTLFRKLDSPAIDMEAAADRIKHECLMLEREQMKFRKLKQYK